MKKTLLLLLLSLNVGCVQRTMTRYSGDGKPWSTERLTLFMVRGEAAKVNEKIKETKGGDYDRVVNIGSIKGETETDKLKDLVAAAVEAAVKAARTP